MTALENIKAALEAGPTPGPWRVEATIHPYKTTSGSGNHIERRIFTTWDHPQLKAPAGVVNGCVGLGVGAVTHFVGIDEADANYIAACNPTAIRELLAYVESLEKDAARWRTAIAMPWVLTADADDYHWGISIARAPGAEAAGDPEVIIDAAMEQTK